MAAGLYKKSPPAACRQGLELPETQNCGCGMQRLVGCGFFDCGTGFGNVPAYSLNRVAGGEKKGREGGDGNDNTFHDEWFVLM